MTRARIFLVGCGFFARNHLHGWAAIADAEVVAVCDLDAEKARQMASEFGIENHGADLEGLLAATCPQIVDIVTSTPSHLDLVRAVAAPGRLVICQKPLADTVTDAVAMTGACDAAGATLLTHENFRWQAPFREARHRVAAGDLGSIEFARFSFRHGYDNYVNQPYLAEIAHFAISDVGTHLFDLVQVFCGPAGSVSCETQTRNPRVLGEDSFAAVVRHCSGAVSIVDCSFEARLAPHRFPQTTGIIEGTRGSIEIAEDYVLVIHDAEGRRTLNVEPPVPDWGARPWHAVQDSVVEFQRHALAVLSGAARPMPSGRFTIGTVALVDAAYRSAAGAGRVDLPSEVPI